MSPKQKTKAILILSALPDSHLPYSIIWCEERKTPKKPIRKEMDVFTSHCVIISLFFMMCLIN